MGTVRAVMAPAWSRPAAYWALAKPDVTLLVVLTTALGYCAGVPGPVEYAVLCQVVFGTMLVAAGTSAMNQYVERGADAVMRRTMARPLPAGVIAPREALALAAGLAVFGVLYLLLFVNRPSALLAAATSVLYLACYTPLKSRTPWCTFVGAFPGAVPPLIGWAAARNSLSGPAWILFLILFLWQFPHFFSIAWMYREDYARAGIRMFPVVDPSGRSTFAQVIGYSAVLVPASLLPTIAGMAGVGYLFGALLLGLALLQVSLWTARERSNHAAKWLMHATVAYIPLLLGLLVFDKLSR